MTRIFFLVIVAMFLFSCSPSPVEITATANIAQQRTQTAAPTKTPTPTLTSTPTFTPTPSPTSTHTVTPTPLGGGGVIAFVSAQGNAGRITFYNIATSETIYPNIQYPKEMNSTFGIQAVSVSQDGTKLAFTQSICPARQSGQTYVFCKRDIFTSSIDGTNVVQLTQTNVDENWPIWSPDSRKIAYVSENRIYVMNADGSERKRLTNGQVPELIPTWSPDGLQIAFPSQRNGNFQLYVFNANRTGSSIQITQIRDLSTFPSWSPDGLRIAFVVYSLKNQTSDIYIAGADGNNPINLTVGKYNKASSPTWSPNGDMIAFLCDQVVCLMNHDGTGITELSGLASNGNGLSWFMP